MVGPSDSFFYSSSTDSSGNIYAVGFIYSNSQYNFGNGITVSGAYASGFNPVIVKYNSSGLAQWARSTVVGPNFSEFNDVSIDSSGDIYVAGYINGNSQYNFGNGVTISGAFTGYNALIVKYNSSGLAQWARSTVVGPKGSEFDSLSIDSSNNIYALGFISDINQYNFGNDVTVSGGYSGSNAVIVKYNSSGLAQWARSTVVGSDYSEFYGSSVDSSGNIYAVGYIYGNSPFGFGNDVTVSGGYDGYNAIIVKYAGEAPPSPPEPEPEPEEDTTPPVFVNLPDIPDTINIKDGQLITTNPYIIKVKPEDDTAISKVEFYVDNNLICTETTSDSQGVYSCFWDTSKYHCFIITVYAYDTSNNRSLALTREAIVDPTLYLIELPKTGREIQCN